MMLPGLGAKHLRTKRQTQRSKSYENQQPGLLKTQVFKSEEIKLYCDVLRTSTTLPN